MSSQKPLAFSFLSQLPKYNIERETETVIEKKREFSKSIQNPPMPPKRKTLSTEPQQQQRSSERLRLKMSKNDAVAAINLSTPTPPLKQKIPNKKKKIATTSPVGPADETPIRHIVYVKKEDDVKRFEEAEDCFMLGFNPMEKAVALISRGDDSPDFAVVAERGQVACRDFPHSRHLCIKFPFDSTPHEKHCELCYCYVCDTAAPCLLWSLLAHFSHCHASEKIGDWKRERQYRREILPAVKK